MALIHCSECNKEISSQAMSCPHCGNPLKGELGTENNPVTLQATSKKWKKRILIFLAIGALGVLLTARMFMLPISGEGEQSVLLSVVGGISLWVGFGGFIWSAIGAWLSNG